MQRFYYLSLFAFSLWYFAVCDAQTVNASRPVVNIKHATLTGISKSGLDFFLGVPFAQPPVNNLRFEPPKPISQDRGNLNVSEEGNRCFRMEHRLDLKASEDCLNLDLVRPTYAYPQAKDETGLLPVMVFIHGGDFNGGDDASYPGEDLVRASIKLGAPIIYISINYRLNFLGFPSGKEAQSHGALNLGLLDQRLALEWVQENIKSFGGNPKKVLLAGSSSGAESVAYHMLSNGRENHELFRAVLLESGSATSSTPIPYPNYTNWQANYDNIINLTGCSNISDSFLCLKATPIVNLVTAIFTTWIGSGLISPSFIYSPVIDGHFLKDYPSVLMAAKKFSAIPMMIGTTTSELTLVLPTNLNISTPAEILQLAEFNYPYVLPSTLKELISYFPKPENLSTGPSIGTEWSYLVDITNYLQMFCPCRAQALYFSAVTSVWAYRWNAVTEAYYSPSYLGVPHMSEVPYLLGPTYLSSPAPTNMSSADLTLTTQFQRKVLSLIYHVDPNILEADKSVPDIFWPQFNAHSEARLVFQRPDSSNIGLHVEVGGLNDTICAFIEEKNVEFLR